MLRIGFCVVSGSMSAKFAVLPIALASSRTKVRRASKRDSASEKLNPSNSASNPNAAPVSAAV